MKKLTEFINEALGGIAWSEFAKVWKGEQLNIDDDHLKNARYVISELMQVHRDKLPTTEEFTNMCRWFVDTYKDQPYVTEEFMEDLLYNFFDIFVMHTQKKTFTKTIKHTKYIDLGDDLFKRETSYEYLTKTIRDTSDMDDDGRVGKLDLRDYDDAAYIIRNHMDYISVLFRNVFWLANHIKKKSDFKDRKDFYLKVYGDILEDFLKRWKISFEDFINKHDYSEGMRILRNFLKNKK